MSTVMKELVVADRKEGKIMNYAGPKILLKSLSSHGDFAPGGRVSLDGGRGSEFLGFGGTRWVCGSVANSIKLPLDMGLMRIATAATYEGSNLICEYVWWHAGPCLKFHALSNLEKVLIAQSFHSTR